MRDGPALRPDHPGPRGQITRGGGHPRAGQGNLREAGEEAQQGLLTAIHLFLILLAKKMGF